MKEVIDNLIGLIKGLMQPLITVFALYVGASLIASGKVSADQAWLIPLGVITYWFADKSGLWDTLFNKSKDSSPKANGPIGTMPAPAGWGTCQTCGSDVEASKTAYTGSTAKTAYTGSTVGFTPIAATVTPADQINPVDKAIDGIIKDIEADGIKSNVASLSARMISWFANHSDELLPAEQQQFIATGLAYASKAFNEATGYPPPLAFVEVERPQTYWLNLPRQCKNCGDAVGRPLVMALRNWLRLKEGK